MKQVLVLAITSDEEDLIDEFLRTLCKLKLIDINDAARGIGMTATYREIRDYDL